MTPHHLETTMSQEAPLLLEKDGPIGWIIFNRPEKRNAVGFETWQLMPDYVKELVADDAIRVVILRGAGDQAFVAGADISQFKDRRKNMDDEEEYRAVVHEGDLLHRAHRLERPGRPPHGAGEPRGAQGGAGDLHAGLCRQDLAQRAPDHPLRQGHRGAARQAGGPARSGPARQADRRLLQQPGLPGGRQGLRREAPPPVPGALRLTWRWPRERSSRAARPGAASSPPAGSLRRCARGETRGR